MPYFMLKRSLKACIFFLLLCPLAWADQAVVEELTLAPQDRILVLAPHPDDEVLGVGGILQRARAMKLPVKVVFLTYGDSNQWSFMLYRKHPVLMPGAVRKMGLVRRDEAMAASSILGVSSDNLAFLGYPDFGTMNMWLYHWNGRPPLRSLLTRVTRVPYKGAFRLGALYKGEEVLKDLSSILKGFKPTKIFVSHPADHNGDHLALYLYLRVALWDLGMDKQVSIFPYLVHYLGWPRPIGYHPDKKLRPPEFLKNSIHWKQFHLTDQEFQLKKAALQAHKTQYASTPKYLLSFVRSNELFGDFPLTHLHPDKDSKVFSIKRKFLPATELPDEFNQREKNAFVGVEWKFVRWQGDDLVVSINLSRPLAQDVEAFIYIFGYNKKVAFKDMPKISVRLGILSYSVYDQSKRIEQNTVAVKRTPDEVTITVPLKLLGNPDHILTSARTYLGNVPLDSASWMALELQ